MSNMTWEEVIIKIRKDPTYKELVEFAYFEDYLPLNIERFRVSEEYLETLKLIQEYNVGGDKLSLADIGAGNGVAAVSFALDGFQVTAIEPDPSTTIGAGAINKLKDHYQLKNLNVMQAWGETIPLESGLFDVVYIRQATHHAAHLNNFIKEAARLLKPGGLLLTTRDHMIYNEKDKTWFLNSHPLHKFYGGENAFSEKEYRNAIFSAGLEIRKSFKHFESVINYYPMSRSAFINRTEERRRLVNESLKNKLPALLSTNLFIQKLYSIFVNVKIVKVFDEKKVPGRMITFFAIKPV